MINAPNECVAFRKAPGFDNFTVHSEIKRWDNEFVFLGKKYPSKEGELRQNFRKDQRWPSVPSTAKTTAGKKNRILR